MNIILLVLLTLHPQLKAATSGHSATLAWNAGAVGSNCAPPATLGYNVYRGSAAGNESATPLNTTLITTTGYVDQSVQMGQTYSYIVKSQETCGSMVIQSVPSNEIIVQFPNPPTAATLQAIVIN